MSNREIFHSHLQASCSVARDIWRERDAQVRHQACGAQRGMHVGHHLHVLRTVTHSFRVGGVGL
jgi:hypothetical protein